MEAGRKNGKGHFGWSDGSMYEAGGLGLWLPTGWRGSLGVWGMYISCIDHNGRLLEACSKPWLHFQDDIFWVSPVSLF